MKKIILLLAVLLLSSLTLAVNLDNDFGTFEAGNGPWSETNINIYRGWNLIPTAVMYNAYGRYNSLFEEGQNICSMNTIGQDVWYYSPLTKGYNQIGTIEDWQWPDSRNNILFQNEFKAKHYSDWGGSTWLYSRENCLLKSDVGGSLVSLSYGSPGNTKYYNTNELTLKKGWNFVAISQSMTYYGRTLEEIFDGCGAVKFNMWNSQTQDWEYNPTKVFDTSDSAVTTPLGDSQVFSTIVIKTTNDCKIMENVANGGSSSAPPVLPN